MTAFAVHSLFVLCLIYIATRAGTLFFQQQDPHGRIADCAIIAFYAACVVGLWPLTWGAPS